MNEIIYVGRPKQNHEASLIAALEYAKDTLRNPFSDEELIRHTIHIIDTAIAKAKGGRP